MKFISRQNILTAVVLIILSLPAIFQLFHKGFFVTDDGEWMIIRFSAFHQALKDGEFPVRFLGRLNQEYGYPVANFLYPGFMYLAEPFHIIGFNFVNSIKIILGFSFILSGVFTYLWLRKFFDKISSCIGALFYIYTPYHLYDLYKRGSVGELVALATIPFILWQIERKSIFWSAIGIGILIVSHNTLAGLFLVFILCYMFLDIYILKKKQYIFLYILILLLGGGIAAFFWIPALAELQYTVFGKTTVSNWREYFANFSLVGYSTLAVLLLTIINVLSKKILIGKHRLTVLLSILFIVSLFFATSLSYQLWIILPANFIQFPFRLLSVTLICVAFLVAANLSILNGYKKLGATIILVAVLLFSAIPFLKPSAHFDKEEGYYATNMATTTVHDEYLPTWMKEKPFQRPERKVEVIKGKGEVQDIFYNNKKVQFGVNSQTTTTVRVNTVYWPGWHATIDGKPISLSYINPKGVIEFDAPQGTHQVQIGFRETPLRLFSDFLSIISLIILFGLTTKTRLYTKGKKL